MHKKIVIIIIMTSPIHQLYRGS